MQEEAVVIYWKELQMFPAGMNKEMQAATAISKSV